MNRWHLAISITEAAVETPVAASFIIEYQNGTQIIVIVIIVITIITIIIIIIIIVIIIIITCCDRCDVVMAAMLAVRSPW